MLISPDMRTYSNPSEWGGVCMKGSIQLCKWCKSPFWRVEWPDKGKVYKISRYLGEKEVMYQAHLKCLNPDHLVTGTQADNIKDRNERRRTATGERNGKAKLSIEQVEYIRNHPEIESRVFAKKYNMHITTINNIKEGRLWKVAA
jgi:DNA-binding transcriptional regulator YiaG